MIGNPFITNGFTQLTFSKEIPGIGDLRSGKGLGESSFTENVPTLISSEIGRGRVDATLVQGGPSALAPTAATPIPSAPPVTPKPYARHLGLSNVKHAQRLT
jgi:hypothetical protein